MWGAGRWAWQGGQWVWIAGSWREPAEAGGGGDGTDLALGLLDLALGAIADSDGGDGGARRPSSMSAITAAAAATASRSSPRALA